MLVSIIIPYNKDRGFLKKAIKSVENQSYEDIELILSQGDYTLGKNFNDGVKKSKGEFIKILADDDLLTHNSIEDLVEGIGKADFITANAINFTHPFSGDYSASSLYKGGIRTLKQMLDRNCIHGGTVLYRRDGFEKYGYMDETLDTAEEYDLHLKWMKAGATQAYTDCEVYMYRLWEGSKSQGYITDVTRKITIQQIKQRYR